MNILAVETSGFTGSIALWQDGVTTAEQVLAAGGRRHAQTLAMEADLLLKSLGLTPGDVDAVAVSVGPGSFTGLRVGVVFAKVFAWANNAQLIAVDTLQAVAEQSPDNIEIVTVISDAQRNEVFVNEFRLSDVQNHKHSLRIALGELRIEPIDVVASATDNLRAVSGPGLSRFANHFSATTRLTEESTWLPRAASVAVIGYRLLQQNKVADVELLEPLYVRRSYAEEK